MIGLRKLSPGGYEYLTGSVACADRTLEPGESLSDYYLTHGYPPGQWYGTAAAELGVDGDVTAAQMNALFGEGRHPDADRIEADLLAEGASGTAALKATKLGHRFYRYDGADQLRSAVLDAYREHNRQQGLPAGAPIDDDTRARLRREVQARAYADAHDGERPSERDFARWLSHQQRTMKSATAGYELVFAPPKSVSVAWALTDDTTRERIADLHRRAVRDTLTYLEHNVAFTRRGDGGHAQHDVRGIAAALFEHWDSRAGDPHLHTHVPISTKVQGPDGRWTSLDGRTIMAASVTLSEFYNSRIRDLFREHGATWTERPAGGIDLKRPVWELDGVPDALLRGFSQRASAVEQDRASRIIAFRREHGREPTPKELLDLSRRAQYGTRGAKQPPRTLDQHVQRWRDQAATLIDTDTLNDLSTRVFSGVGDEVANCDVVELAAATRRAVSDRHSHFNVWNLEAEAHRQTAHLRVADGTRPQLIEQIVRTVVTAHDTISLEPPSLVEEPSTLRRANGESVFVEHNSQRYTTRQTLQEEAALAGWGQSQDGHRVPVGAVERALGRARLNAGQRRSVHAFATSGRRVQLLHAPAGAGKTSAMRTFAQLWRAEVGRVYAFGPSARAAQELGKAIDARPHTLHQVTTAMRLGVVEATFPFGPGDVLVIDEVAMAGTHTLHSVVDYALLRGADVRWVGDPKQLTAVEAGGAVRWFEQHNGAVRLTDVVRFTDSAQAAASLRLRDGDPSGLDYYFAQDWVRSGSRETIRDAAHRAWRADLDQGRQTLLVVPTNVDVTALNRQARALRVHRGDVDDQRTVALHDGTHAGAGDWVVTRHNDRLKTFFSGQDFVKNGDTWDVLKVRRGKVLKLRHRSSGGTVVLPADYVAQHVELAYASTVHRVQGMSVAGSTHNVVPQELSREQLYTLVTRANQDNRLYVETHKHTIDAHQETPPERTARSALETVLARSSAETAANEQLRVSLDSVETLSTLIPRYNHAVRLATDRHVASVIAQHTPALTDTTSLHATLCSAEELGWRAEQLLTTALETVSVDQDSADDGAALLQGHIRQRLEAHMPSEDLDVPTPTDMHRWRTLIERHVPTANVEENTWMPVWRRAAAAQNDGLDGDTALDTAAQHLASRPVDEPMNAHRLVDHALTAALQEQRTSDTPERPVLPWMASVDLSRLNREEPDLSNYLRQLESAIATRLVELRTSVTTEPSRWTAALGTRPSDEPDLGERWDHLATLAAAYRETYTITSTDPAVPIEQRPPGQNPQAYAWDQLTRHWSSPMATPSEVGRNQQAIDKVRDDLNRPSNEELVISTQYTRRDDERDTLAAAEEEGHHYQYDWEMPDDTENHVNNVGLTY